ncbi:MAG: hypothetical protein JWO42_3257 [Chloroflexi bacterium]|nr:hypothetical protein [Chloroflexota bacterium]
MDSAGPFQPHPAIAHMAQPVAPVAPGFPRYTMAVRQYTDGPRATIL